jgi:hypothetical protein
MGRRVEAVRMLDQLKQFSKERYISNFDFALVYTGLGDLDKAFQSLENSLRAHDGNIVYLKADPLLADLRNDPRYFDLIKRVGLDK